MSYDTEHVRNAAGTPTPIAGLPTYTELLDNAALADIYASIDRTGSTTAPELVETADVSKKTVYDYLDRLERAGLISEVGDDAGTAVYETEAFELTVRLPETEVSITPDLVAVAAHGDEYPSIGRVIEEHGLVTFALVHDLVKTHAEGDVTIRQIAELSDLSTGTTYDLVEALYSVLDLGEDAPAPTRFEPGDFDDEESDLLEEVRDE